MAYGLKYYFRYHSTNDTPVEVTVSLDGYTGSPLQRRLGAAPVLKTRTDGCIISSSLELVAECRVDGEFAEFYTTDAHKFLVEVYRGDDGEGDGYLVWRGFVTPEIYSEPYIAPPYDVRVYANDGLGELKEYDWVALGTLSLKDTIYAIMDKAVIDTSAQVYVVSELVDETVSGGAAEFYDDTQINLDHLAGESFYDVFQTLLESLNMTVRQVGLGGWMFIRETDLDTAGGENLSVIYLSRNGSSYIGTFYNAVRTIGQMGNAFLWPIGHMTRTVEPAKKKVVVEAPWHLANAFANPNMSSRASWGEDGTIAYGDNGYYLGRVRVSSADLGTIYQFPAINYFNRNLRVTVKAAANRSSFQSAGSVTRGVGVWVARTLNGSTKYYSSGHDGWSDELSVPEMTPINSPEPADFVKNAGYQEVSFEIPYISPYSYVSSIQISIAGYGVVVRSAEVTLIDDGGYKDVLLLDNGARGEADEVEIVGGRMVGENIASEIYYGGIMLTQAGTAARTFSDAVATDVDFLSLNALGRAKKVAMPRIRITGRYNTPSTFINFPIILRDGSTDLIIESYEWDLYNDEITIEAITLPSASLVVESETITPLD